MTPDDTRPIGSAAAYGIVATLDELKAPGGLHAAVVIRASNGRTALAQDLTNQEAQMVVCLGQACAAEPVGFAEATLAQFERGGNAGCPEAVAIAAWLTEAAT